MKNLYIKDSDDNYIPVELDLFAVSELVNKLIVITLGSDEFPVDGDILDNAKNLFESAEIIRQAMSQSTFGDLLIIPHTICLELLSKKELEIKTVCIQINNTNDINDLPEFKKEIKKILGKEAVILPSPISINEYKEVKAIKERIDIRKQRHGGALMNK